MKKTEIENKNFSGNEINVDWLIKTLANMPNRNYNLDPDQEQVVKHGNGPLWVIAGPGSGKTDSIVFRCIKLLVVDHVPPASIILTTFTKKASVNLQNRISEYMIYLSSREPSIGNINYNRVRINTLHALCVDIMEEFRFTGYQNYRPLDELEQRLFIMEHLGAASIDKDKVREYDEIWKEFSYVFEGYDYLSGSSWSPKSKNTTPNKNVRSVGLSILFDRIVGDMVDKDKLESAGGGWSCLLKAYNEYKEKLFKNYRCDFSHMLEKFLEFLNSPESKLFIEGDGTDQYPGVNYVLVDEYQDTNLIQEEIYLKLSDRTTNICVVGDDDQALYRFRGGTVECMVNFGNSCKERWPRCEVKKIFLSVNYRSNSKIVKFYDSYIKSFDEMRIAGARVSGKHSLKTGSKINGDYPSVANHRNRDGKEAGEFFAKMVKYFKENHIISDYSECVLLLRSPKRNPKNAGPFMDALDNEGIPYYNPRSKGLLDEYKIQIILGGLLSIIDPDREAQNRVLFSAIKVKCDEWRYKFQNFGQKNPDLMKHVEKYAKSLLKIGPKTSIGVNLLELFYDILNYPPLSEWIDDPEISEKIGVICKTLDSYSNVPTAKNTKIMLGSLYTSSKANKGISFSWRVNFYYTLLGILTSEGLNETEDEIENFPKGKVSIMTIHQSKGLQFPVVFVYGLSINYKTDKNFKIEETFYKYRKKAIKNAPNFTTEDKNVQDNVRLYYVAYSRAQYALILLTINQDYKKPGVGIGGSPNWSIFQSATEI